MSRRGDVGSARLCSVSSFLLILLLFFFFYSLFFLVRTLKCGQFLYG